MITFLLALLAVFVVCVVGMILAAILDRDSDLVACPPGDGCDCCHESQEAGR